MPFQSERQRRYMWMHHPEIAKRWTDKYGSKAIHKTVAAKLVPTKKVKSGTARNSR